ncbi:MAG: cyclic nucleotide-binding domain-containing protein [Acidobacteriota bacterium]
MSRFESLASPPTPHESSSPRRVTAEDLAAFPLFADIDHQELEPLATTADELHVEANHLLVREGEVAEALYLVQHGAVAVFRDAVGLPVQLLARLAHGEFFGELGLVGAGTYSASVRATEPTRLVRLAADTVRPWMTRHPAVQLELQATAARRHSHSIASVLELGRRREVRIRCGHEVEMHVEGAAPLRVVLENLSLGGLCLSRAPETWSVDTPVRFGLRLREGMLELAGRIVWRGGDTAGVCFVKKSPSHDMIVQMAIRLIVESAS